MFLANGSTPELRATSGTSVTHLLPSRGERQVSGQR